MTGTAQSPRETRTLVDALLDEQRDLTAAVRFARWHDAQPDTGIAAAPYRTLIPLTTPGSGEQYAFEVDLDRCSGCKSCVTACHALNGLDDDETWRSVGLLHGGRDHSFQQTVTTACHHCVDPACLNGCPVLAYDKDPLTGIVRHLDDQCIGCQYCIFMCPYDVPKYSESRGIVRKCDMCHQRLAHGEAPACVQACPSQAIRITTVKQDSLRREYRPDSGDFKLQISNCRTGNPELVLDNRRNSFLPCAPEPALTLPTTRYVSAKPLASDLVAGDAHEVKLQMPHVPLVWMLVLTQMSAGGFALLPFTPAAAQLRLSLLSLVAAVLGLTGSVLHLGRPQKAWRAFLGWRRSWLSREILTFGAFLLLAATTFSITLAHAKAPGIVIATALAGIAGVFCSGMTYHVTGRECWNGELSLGRFFATTGILGLAITWSVTEIVAEHQSAAFAVALAVLSTICFWRELATVRSDSNGEPLSGRARTAAVIQSHLGMIWRIRLACLFVGGIALPLVGCLPGSPRAASIGALTLCLAGEFASRWLFFRSAVMTSMPGDRGA